MSDKETKLNAVDEIESIVHDVIQKAWAPTPPPPSETKLSEALDELEVTSATNRYTSEDQKARSDARSSLESLYRELLEEKRLAEASFCAFHTREYLYAGLPIHRKAIECRNEEIDDLRSELSALRSLQLTPEEAESTQYFIEHFALDKDYRRNPQLTSAIEKLQRISSKATSEEL